MNKRDLACGNKLCPEYWEELINHCEMTSLKREGACPNYFPDPTELAIQINDNGGNDAPKNRGSK